MKGDFEVTYLEDAVNDTTDVREGVQEGVKAGLPHSVEGLSDCLCLLLGSFQLLCTALLPLLQQDGILVIAIYSSHVCYQCRSMHGIRLPLVISRGSHYNCQKA